MNMELTKFIGLADKVSDVFVEDMQREACMMAMATHAPEELSKMAKEVHRRKPESAPTEKDRELAGWSGFMKKVGSF